MVAFCHTIDKVKPETYTLVSVFKSAFCVFHKGDLPDDKQSQSGALCSVGRGSKGFCPYLFLHIGRDLLALVFYRKANGAVDLFQ